MNIKHSFGSAVQSTNRRQKGGTTGIPRRWWNRGDWGRRLVGGVALAAATTTALDLGLGQLLERQLQTLWMEVRGTVEPPQDIVILAIDETSLAQGEFFRVDPQRYAHLEPIQAFPWQRSAYATAIDRLMAAGAKAIAIDLIFSAPSSYGLADDQRFAQSLQQHQGQVVLAAQYSEQETPQGYTVQLTTPLDAFCSRSDCLGFINFLLEPDGRIHRLGDRFLTQLLSNSPTAQAEVVQQLAPFATSTLAAAQVNFPAPKGDSIFFYGPARTFEQVPFWSVLDADTWKNNLQSGAYFKDKIVLIGSTAVVHQDFHAAPFSKSWLYREPMAGVEIHANAIATLMQGRSIAEAIPSPFARGLMVLVGTAAAGWWFTRPKTPMRRFTWALGVAIGWLGISYGLFVLVQLIIPTAVPVGAIMFGGVSQLILGTVREQVRKRQLRDTLKQYVTSPIVQEIISQDDDLQDLLRERELALAGKVLGSRYRILRVLGSGGFSETYVAEDLQRPGNPYCVVKQLRVMSSNPNTLRQARRLFATEAETLERLGQHPQIPQLLAYFEENQEFYLIQEFVRGNPLLVELLPDRSLSEVKVVELLHDLLGILQFVHGQNVIHRDLKPSNIIRRKADNKLILIDFGIARKITTRLAESSGETKFTIAVGTPGYMPPEQAAGYPQFNSDLYALGMIAIEALTGQAPHTLSQDAKQGTVKWMQQARWVNPALVAILNRMVHPDFKQRYPSVQAVQADLSPLVQLVLSSDAESIDCSTVPPCDPASEITDEAVSDMTVPLPQDWMNE